MGGQPPPPPTTPSLISVLSPHRIILPPVSVPSYQYSRASTSTVAVSTLPLRPSLALATPAVFSFPLLPCRRQNIFYWDIQLFLGFRKSPPRHPGITPSLVYCLHCAYIKYVTYGHPFCHCCLPNVQVGLDQLCPWSLRQLVCRHLPPQNFPQTFALNFVTCLNNSTWTPSILCAIGSNNTYVSAQNNSTACITLG